MQSDRQESQFLREAFLTRAQKDVLKEWKKPDGQHDKSVFGNLFNPFYEFLAGFIPNNISPNVISLVGLLTAVLAWEWSCRETLDYLDLQLQLN